MTDLTSLSAIEMARLLAAREISSEELVRAHLERARVVEPRLRAFTEILRDDALAAAKRADEERARGEARGPLHGLPISVKESLDYAGHPSTLGLSERLAHRPRADAGIVELAKRGGAVVLGRTNVSQLLLFHECRNPVYGQTANPWSIDHAPGGSSGGEAAAIGAGLVPLGIGTDIGGSIRVPAHFSGIAGLKPTLDRWTNKGSNTALVGQEVVRSQLGPMARTARDCAFFFGAFDPKAMSLVDGRVPPLPFGDPAAVDVTKLKVGVFSSDGVIPPALAVARAVDEAARALEAAGAKVVSFAPPGLEELAYLYIATMSSDGADTLRATYGEIELDPALASLRSVATMPRGLRIAAARAAKIAGERRLGKLLDVVGRKTVAELWALTAKLRAARAAMLEAMEQREIDLLLCPVHATPALPHGMSRDFAIAGSFCMHFNIAQLPAGVVPVTRVRPDETARPVARDRFEKRAREVDAKSAGLPVGVQLVGRPWEEDRVLAAMIAVEDRLPSAPRTPHVP